MKRGNDRQKSFSNFVIFLGMIALLLSGMNLLTPSSAYAVHCGDGFWDLPGGEECDDGNLIDGDGCSSICTLESFCGDGNLDPGEGCDDRNNIDGDGCSAVCTVEAYCGDGFLDDGEACDDGNNVDGDGCSSNCIFEPYCGDGYLDAGEQCDDGNNANGDGCSADCTYENAGEGCTPGYWKQSQHFGSYAAPYTPDTLFSDVFDDAFPDMTFLQVLKQGGGGLKALGRHVVAALLNGASGSVDYDLSVDEIIIMFNAVYPGQKYQYESKKNELNILNEMGCPLGRDE